MLLLLLGVVLFDVVLFVDVLSIVVVFVFVFVLLLVFVPLKEEPFVTVVVFYTIELPFSFGIVVVELII